MSCVNPFTNKEAEAQRDAVIGTQLFNYLLSSMACMSQLCLMPKVMFSPLTGLPAWHGVRTDELISKEVVWRMGVRVRGLPHASLSAQHKLLAQG